MSKYCKQCDLWEKKKGTEEYEKWKETHDNFCSITKAGSCAMGVTGLKQIYRRSMKNHKLRYKYLLKLVALTHTLATNSQRVNALDMYKNGSKRVYAKSKSVTKAKN